MDDHALSRREFLERTAYAAGLAGMAGALPLETLLAEAAHANHRGARLPSPRNMEIDHFVILMMENRSFDHYFGWLSDVADGIQHQTFRDPQGRIIPTRHASTLGESMWQGCHHADPGHGWESGRAELRGGFLAEGSGNDEFALTYYNRGEIPAIHGVAEHYTIYDRYFCSLLGPTLPNRYYKWSAQSGGMIGNSVGQSFRTGGNQWETIFDRALGRGVSARYYHPDLPISSAWGPRAIPWTNPITRFYTDCAAGTLPSISFVDPPFRIQFYEEGLSADEHPLGDVRLGQAFVADVMNAFVSSPNYPRGAMFIVYDEWGGFFDHVTPPRVPDDRASSNLYKDFGQMGFRIPAAAISPYARGRTRTQGFRVDHGVYGHESILKLISYRFGLGYLNKRHRYARNIGHSFDWENPDFERPPLPTSPTVVTSPCSVRADDPEQAHTNDLAELEGLARRFGFPVHDAKPHEIFTEPLKLRSLAPDLF